VADIAAFSLTLQAGRAREAERQGPYERPHTTMATGEYHQLIIAVSSIENPS